MADAVTKKIGGIWTVKQLIFFLVGIVVAAVFFIIPPFQVGGAEPLSANGMKVLGLFLMAVFWWIGNCFADFITGLVMLTAFLLFGITKINVAFSAFSGSVIWVVVPALAIGAALSKSGLLQRIVLIILSKFKGTFSSLVAGFLVAGTVVGPLIPSATAKVAIATPLARSFSETAGFGVETKAAAGLFSATWISFGTIGPLFLTGTTMTVTMIALLPEANQAAWTWVQWFIAALPWGIVLLVLSFIFIRVLYKPKDDTPLPEDFVKGQLAELGAWSRNEKIAMGVLIGAIVLWILGPVIYSGLNTMVVAMLAMFILFGTGVLERSDFRTRIGWEAVAFIGVVTSLAAVFTEAEISTWVSASFGTFVAPVFSNPFTVVIAVVVLVSLLRFIFVSQTALMTLVTLVAVPFCLSSGIDPWIAGFAALVTVNVWNTSYMNGTFITANAASDSMAKFKDTKKMSYVYMLSCLAGCLACVPVWMALGMC